MGMLGKLEVFKKKSFKIQAWNFRLGLLWSSLSKDAKNMVGIGPTIKEKFYQSEGSTKKSVEETFLALNNTEYSVQGKCPLGF